MRFANMMKPLFLLAIGICLSAHAAGYYYGRVIDINNNPVQGVAVSLDLQKLTATTNAQGQFALGTVGAENMVDARYARQSITLAGSKLVFNNFATSASLGINLFSMQGCLLKHIAVDRMSQYASVDLSAALSLFGDGCYYLQVRGMGENKTLLINRVGRVMHKSGNSGEFLTQQETAALHKLANIVDTLGLMKSTFLTNRMNITDSTVSNLGDLKLYPMVTGTASKYYGFDRYDFQLNGKSCIIVLPKKPATGNPWIWRPIFFDHKAYMDSILCSRGYYMGYIDMPDLYGCPTAVATMTSFYVYLTTTYGFSKKPILHGVSRGGLYIYNWARSNLTKVSCLSGDVACMDIISWPCACYPVQGTPSPDDWIKCKNVYGFSNDSIAKAYIGNPYQNMRVFADAKTPLIHVYATADPAAVPSQNVLRANDSLKKWGGSMTILAKPGVGHVAGVTLGDGALPGQADTFLNFLLKNTSF
jgi:hypothetical protein